MDNDRRFIAFTGRAAKVMAKRSDISTLHAKMFAAFAKPELTPLPSIDISGRPVYVPQALYSAVVKSPESIVGLVIEPFIDTFELDASYMRVMPVMTREHGTPGWYSNFSLAGTRIHTVDDFGNLVPLSGHNLVAAANFILAGAAHDSF